MMACEESTGCHPGNRKGCESLWARFKAKWAERLGLGGSCATKAGEAPSREATLFVSLAKCTEADMKPLADDAAKKLFKAVLGEKPKKYGKPADYNWLIRQLEGQPLAIALMALQTRELGYLNRAGWEKAVISSREKQSHTSLAIALRTSWEAIRQEPQAAKLWGVFHASVVPLGVEVLKGLFDGKEPRAGLGKLRSLGLVYRVEGAAAEQFDMPNPIRRQFLILAGKGAVEAARKRWLAYLRALLPRADQAGVPKEKRVSSEQECAVRRTVHGLLPQVWRLLEDLCAAKEAAAAAELMRLARNFFLDGENSTATLEVLRGFFRGESERREDFAFATRCLGAVWRRLGEYDRAVEAYEEALAICRKIGDRQGEAHALRGVGDVWRARGEYAVAEEAYEALLAIYREIGDWQGEAHALREVGDVRRLRGEGGRAEEAYDKALAICWEIGDRQGEANALLGLGEVRRMRGEYDGAKEAYEASLAICREIGDWQGEANALLGVDNVRNAYNRPEEAYLSGCDFPWQGISPDARRVRQYKAKPVGI